MRSKCATVVPGSKAKVEAIRCRARDDTWGGTGSRHFGTDERGTIFQDSSNTSFAAPANLVTGGTVGPVQ